MGEGKEGQRGKVGRWWRGEKGNRLDVEDRREIGEGK